MAEGIQGRKIQYIFTGTPRSGTGFISQLLTSGGLKIGHEMFFGMPGHGVYPKGAVGDSSWMAVPFLRLYKDAVKVHIVRDPVKTISSLLFYRMLEDEVIGINIYSLYKVISLKGLIEHTGLDRYIFFWIAWNTIAMEECDRTFKLENITKNPKHLLKFLKIGQENKKLNKKKYNSYDNVKQLTMKDFKDCDKNLLKEFKLLSLKLGYKL